MARRNHEPADLPPIDLVHAGRNGLNQRDQCFGSHEVVANRHVEMVRKLIERGHSQRDRSGHRNPPFLIALSSLSIAVKRACRLLNLVSAFAVNGALFNSEAKTILRTWPRMSVR
jgi:hypothetical protein